MLLDEIDGLSIGDRGGVTEMIQLINDTEIPIICVGNDRQHQNMRTLSSYAKDLKMILPGKVKDK